MKRILKFSILLFALVAFILLSRAFLRREGSEAAAQFVSTRAEPSGFARAQGPQPLNFPADHGPHTDYQTEWWYYTGNLETADGRHFGYQLTFFRRALLPPELRQDRASPWAVDQVYLAHFALTDVAAGRYHAFERLSRGAADLAGAQASPYHVWLEDWEVEEVESGVYRLRALEQDLEIALLLNDQKGPVLQGDRGYSQKGPERGNASYYYSLTRLASSGVVRVGDAAYEVTGQSWMDHEFSTSALAPDQVGWDWFSLQLESGEELMVFQIRKADGSVDPFSSGTFIANNGQTIPLDRDDFEIEVGGRWRSPRSGATYPARWTVRVSAVDLELDITPYLADQELNVSYVYWEGAVRVSGERAGRPVRGDGYVELTGYAGSMQDQF